MARTTAIELKGDRYKAEQLSLAHTQRLLRTFRENSAFQSLQQNKHEENFFDETGAYIGKISIQNVFGVETVIVDVRPEKPTPQKEEWKLRQRQVDTLIPCFICTGEANYSREIVGIIASLGGSFTGPYYWFSKLEDDDALVMEAFYHEGFMYYDAAVAFEHMRILSISNDKTLYFFRPSGLAPADSRAEDGPDYGSIVQTESCGAVAWYDGADSEWVWTAAMAHNPIGGGGVVGFDQLFDGGYIGDKYRLTVSYAGSYFVGHAEDSCTALEEGQPPPQSCYDAIDAFKVAFEFPASCTHTSSNTNSFDRYETTITVTETFLDDFPNGNIRLNGTIAASVYLLERWQQDKTVYTWNHQPLPSPYNNEWGTLQCPGCYSEDLTWQVELFIVADNGARQSITAAFAWEPMRKYRGLDGEGIVYHKSEAPGESISLAVAKSGVADINGDGDLTDMAFVYIGPAADEFQGSVSFPLLNQGYDDYVEIPEVIGMPEDVTYRVRGQIFLGIIRTIVEEKVQVYS